jgi:hypothetical protein
MSFLLQNGLFVINHSGAQNHLRHMETIAASIKSPNAISSHSALGDAASSSILWRILYCSMGGAQSKAVSPAQKVHERHQLYHHCHLSRQY